VQGWHALQKVGVKKMENENAPAKVEEPKTKQKRKKGKIKRAYEMHEKGATVKEISQKLGINERIVRSYLWRSANPEKFKALLARYYAKKKAQQVKKKEA
jgi:hypothetical protein